MPATLPDRPNLEHLKAQAKALHTAYQSADPQAMERVRPYFDATAKVGLNQAQLVVAREYGFESWAKLKTHVALHAGGSSGNRAARADDLARTAATVLESAVAVRAALDTDPALATTTLAAACISGDSACVRGFLDAEPVLTNTKIAPLDWEPLLYLCYSSLLRDADYRPRLVETARLLLERGADPKVHWVHPDYPDSDETCLYGATGAHDCPALAELLLKAGANADDNEALYHSTELATWDCLKLLMQYGGSIDNHNVLAHLLDREEPEWLRMMLSFVKDAAKIPPILPFALRRGRSEECFRILVDSGMNLNAPDPGQGSRTPYQVATRLGRTDVAEMLAASGADTTLSAADAIIGRLTRGEVVPVVDITPEIVADLDAEKPTPTITVLAERGQDAALDALLAAGASPNVVDGNGWNGLHLAALNGRLSTIRVLLKHHADPVARDAVHNGTPIGFACAGSTYHQSAPPDDYVQIIVAMLDAGTPLPETAWGSPEVQALLVSRGSKPTG